MREYQTSFSTLEIIVVIFITLFVTFIYYQDIDENGMNSLDHLLGISGDGRKRSQYTGIVYDKNGNFDFRTWMTL